VDALVIAFIAVQAVVIAVAVALAWDRGQMLDRLSTLTGGRRDQIEPRVRELQKRSADLEWRSQQLAADFGRLADLTGAGVVRLNDDDRVEFANRTAHAYLNRATGSLVGHTAVEAFIDGRIEAIADTAKRTGYGTGELTVRAADGPTLLVRARRSPVSGSWVIIEDVSELRRLQRMRAEFTENLSHELRTPLSTISLLAETLAREADEAGHDLPARMRERINKIEVETGHLVQMINELLDLSRIERGGPMALLDDVDLVRLAHHATERLRLFAERQGVELAVDAPAQVPVVRGDEERLGQVLINLVHNAVKFSPDGGTVTVAVRPGDDEIITSVQDQGIGIPQAALTRVFERFYKVDRARVRGGGTGLGLSIAKHVVEAHGGRIWVESDEGAGSTFSVALPIHLADGAGPPPR
jgi:two-component system, OmpR family, phosphate regulon sensor histidine kinase PhoR